MSYLLTWLVFCYPVTFVLYLSVMWLERWRDAQPRSPILLALGESYVIFCVAWDFLVNVFPTCLTFWEFTIEGSISQRLRRLVKEPGGWRRDLAVWVAKTLLNPYSNNGSHIKL